MDGPDAGEGPDHRRGFWVSEAAWPSPKIDSLALHLSEKGALSESAGEEAAMAVASPLTTGLGDGRFYPKHGRVDLTVAQRTAAVEPRVFAGDTRAPRPPLT